MVETVDNRFDEHMKWFEKREKETLLKTKMEIRSALSLYEMDNLSAKGLVGRAETHNTIGKFLNYFWE